MKNIYRMTFSRKCPVDHETIEYALEIEASNMIRAEDIEAAIDALPPAVLHEEAADALDEKLDGFHVLRARHGRVEIETHRP